MNEEELPHQQEQETEKEDIISVSGGFFMGLRNLEEQKDYMQCTLMAFPASAVWLIVKLLGPLVAVFIYITYTMETILMGMAFVLVIFALLMALAWLNRKTLRIDRQQVILDGREFDRREVKGFRTFDVETTLFSTKFGPAFKGAKIGFDYGDGFVRYSGFYAPSEAEKVVNLLNGYLKKYG